MDVKSLVHCCAAKLGAMLKAVPLSKIADVLQPTASASASE